MVAKSCSCRLQVFLFFIFYFFIYINSFFCCFNAPLDFFFFPFCLCNFKIWHWKKKIRISKIFYSQLKCTKKWILKLKVQHVQLKWLYVKIKMAFYSTCSVVFSGVRLWPGTHSRHNFNAISLDKKMCVQYVTAEVKWI